MYLQLRKTSYIIHQQRKFLEKLENPSQRVQRPSKHSKFICFFFPPSHHSIIFLDFFHPYGLLCISYRIVFLPYLSFPALSFMYFFFSLYPVSFLSLFVCIFSIYLSVCVCMFLSLFLSVCICFININFCFCFLYLSVCVCMFLSLFL